jgi:hypothetical protein
VLEKWIDPHPIGASLQLTPAQTEWVVRYLKERNWVRLRKRDEKTLGLLVTISGMEEANRLGQPYWKRFWRENTSSILVGIFSGGAVWLLGLLAHWIFRW